MNKKLEARIKELEEIVREKNHTINDMYNSDLESSWNNKADKLQYSYQEKYKVNLEYNDET